MNAKHIQREVRRYFGNYDYKLFNTFLFNWESDFFAISKSDYSVEVEVKISRGDFFADFKKAEKHKVLSSYKLPAIVHNRRPCYRYKDEFKAGDFSNLDYTVPGLLMPNKFYYACPNGLIKPHEVPAYAGLLYCRDDRSFCGLEEIKKAPFLHKIKNDHTKTLLNKYYHSHIDINNEFRSLLFTIKNRVDGYAADELKRLLNKFNYD